MMDGALSVLTLTRGEPVAVIHGHRAVHDMLRTAIRTNGVLVVQQAGDGVRMVGINPAHVVRVDPVERAQ